MSGSANAGTTAERHQMRELKILTKKVRALASAPGHVCFSLTEDLHGCRLDVTPWPRFFQRRCVPKLRKFQRLLGLKGI